MNFLEKMKDRKNRRSLLNQRRELAEKLRGEDNLLPVKV